MQSENKSFFLRIAHSFLSRFFVLNLDTWLVFGLISFDDSVLRTKCGSPLLLLVYRVILLPLLHVILAISVMGVGTRFSYVFTSWLAAGLIVYFL